MNDSTSPVADNDTAKRTHRRIVRRLMPFLICLFALAYIDRVNVSYAALGMTGELGFDPQVLGFGAGIFFIGYFLLENTGNSNRRKLERPQSPFES